MAPDPVDRLYDLPPAEFTAARDALAKELRASGDRDAAAAVKGLRKPSAAAWAINRAAREEPATLATLLDAADALRAAHERLVAGEGSRDELREATEAQRAAIGAMVAAAARAAGSLSAPVESRVRETLHAAALDDGVRAALAAGRLEREAEAAGFAGAGTGTSPPGAPRPRAPAKRPATGDAAGKERAARERAARERARKERDAAREALSEANRAAREAEREAEAAARRLDRAQASLQDARERLAAAEDREASDRAACEEAQRTMRAAKGAAAAAQAAFDEAEERASGGA